VRKEDLYETLGVGREASADEIRKAYRRKAKKAHPDAGGKAGDFEELALAHTVLIDEEKRRIYDTTGFIKGEDDIRLEALDLMFELGVAAVIENETPDILFAIKSKLATSRKLLHEKRSLLERGAASIRKSWTGAEEVRDYIASGFDRSRAQLERREKVYDACWKLLDGAEFAGQTTTLAAIISGNVHLSSRFPRR
jgi:curved DNA-binding protein CbpA